MQHSYVIKYQRVLSTDERAVSRSDIVDLGRPDRAQATWVLAFVLRMTELRGAMAEREQIAALAISSFGYLQDLSPRRAVEISTGCHQLAVLDLTAFLN